MKPDSPLAAGLDAALGIADSPLQRRRAIGLSTDQALEMAHTARALDALARMAVEVVTARRLQLVADTETTKAAADAAFEGALDQLDVALELLGYVNPPQQEAAYGDQGEDTRG